MPWYLVDTEVVRDERGATVIRPKVPAGFSWVGQPGPQGGTVRAARYLLLSPDTISSGPNVTALPDESEGGLAEQAAARGFTLADVEGWVA